MQKLALLILVLPVLHCGAPDDLGIGEVDNELLPVGGGEGGGGGVPKPPPVIRVYCWRDADGDGQGGGATGTYFTGKVCPTGWTTTVGDCNDSDRNTFTRWCPRDLDGDGHAGLGTVQVCTNACPSLPMDDCNDNDATVMPRPCEEDADGDGWTATVTRCVASCAPATPNSGDCAPNDPKVHPLAHEVYGNGVDDNCNGRTDESELSYDWQGGQGATSLFIQFFVNDATLANWSYGGNSIYVRATYFALSNSANVMQGPWTRAVMHSTSTGGLAGVFSLDGLAPSTPYQVSFDYARNADGSSPFTARSNDYYAMTLAQSADRVEQIRPLMVNLAFSEWNRGQLGDYTYGYEFCGARCDSNLGTGHNWCSEFYNWVANHWFIPMFTIVGSDQVDTGSIIDAFQNHGGVYYSSAVAYDIQNGLARPGDYLPIGDNGANIHHSEMFLAYDASTNKTWQIAGNVGNHVGIGTETPSNLSNLGLGHLTAAMIK
jgi:hypothetical protein